MKSTTIDSLLHESEKLKNSQPREAYILIQKAAKKALQSKDLFRLARADEIKSALARTLGDMTIAQSSAQSALLFYRAKKMPEREANCLILLGQNSLLTRNHTKALQLFQDAEHLVRNTSDHPMILATAVGLQGQANLRLGHPVEALNALLKNLNICEKNNLTHGTGVALQNIAAFYALQEDYNKSLKYSQEAISFLRIANDKYSECYVLNNIGIAHSLQHRLKEAHKCFSTAYKIALGLGIANMTTWTLSNLIEQHILDNKVKEAGKYLKKLVLLSEQVTDLESKAGILSSAAAFYFAINKPQLAIQNLLMALETLSSSRFGKIQVLEKLVEAYVQTNDPENTIKTLKEYLALKDELFSLENQKGINLIEEKRESINNSLVKDKQLEKYSLHRLEKKEFVVALKQRLEQNKKTRPAVINAIEDQVRHTTDLFDHESYISVTYNDFIMRLSKRFPNFSSAELKIATLLRLNMSSKKIASLLSISVRTVEFHRINIRKKMRLDTKDNLNLFLMKV